LGHEEFARSLIGLISTSIIMVLVTIVMNFLCGIYLTHRFAGPMKVINEYIEDLIAGKYGSRHELRPTDELKPIMNKLKELSQKLQGSR
jgi:signal transduction histidine kinase